jgi:anhydro-N-acetylmuramic acid kinase
MDSLQIYKVIGLMSGTSLDGLDIAYCVFKKENGSWTFSIEKAATLAYTASWTKMLSTAHLLSGEALLALDAAYGKFLGKACVAFVKKHKLKVDFIASHGHTIFHQPKNGFTFQLGNANSLYAACGLPVIADFRSKDVALGGQGAPLVPVGDRLLFADYDVCLNLGGIANLSMEENGERKAFDSCFVNIGLNYLAAKKGKSFDKGGALAYSGEVNKKMLTELTKFYRRLHVKRPSLGRELFEKNIQPLLDQKKISTEDKLRTFLESSALEIAQAFPSRKKFSVLCTGGGAFNSFLIATLLDKCGDKAEIILPDEEVIKFKEALIFAFLGVLRLRNEVNCLASVTGASVDHSGGVMVGF